MKIIAKTEYSVTEYCNLGTNPEIRIDLQLFSIYEWIETKKPDFRENWDAFNGCIPLSRTHCIVITRSIIISNKCVCFFFWVKKQSNTHSNFFTQLSTTETNKSRHFECQDKTCNGR